MPDVSKKYLPGNQYVKPNIEKLMQNQPEVMFVTDRKGNLLFSNEVAALTCGVPMRELLNLNMRDLIRGGNINRSYTLEAAEAKRIMRGFVTSTLKIELLATSTPVLDEREDVSYILTTCRPKNSKDITLYKERLRTEFGNWAKDSFCSRVLEPGKIVAESAAMKSVLLTANMASRTDSSTVLCGESGTGKEILARYIHDHSKRAKGPFITVNCAALPENLAESELFGYDKGAFTGANVEGKVGLIEAAQGGTLFLDEIGELPLSIQAKFLRVLETGEVRRVGSCAERIIDFRVVAASNKDLKKMMLAGLFRNDLYYRLNVIPITIAPLRERPEDIVALAMKFLAEFSKKYDVNLEIGPDTMEAFHQHDWPGNVRELRNEVEKMVVNNLQDYPTDCLMMLTSMQGQFSPKDCRKHFGDMGTLRRAMRQFEEQYIDSVLKACDLRIGAAAERLGICRTVLYRKLKAFESEKAKKQLTPN